MDDVLGGTVGQKALLGVGIGAVTIGVGAVAWLATRGDGSHADDLDGGPLPDGRPATLRGPADLAVAWWPQDIHLDQHGEDATLRFQSTVANVGGKTAKILPGDHLLYTVRRQDTKGNLGEIVGAGSTSLDHADVQPFPVTAGHGVGHDLSELGRTLRPVDELEPEHAEIVGSDNPSQAITIKDARAGLYVLRQQIMRGDGSTDSVGFDDARLTEFILDGKGGILHTSSRYAGLGQIPNNLPHDWTVS